MMYHGEPVTMHSIVLGALALGAAAFARGATGYRRYGPDAQPTLIEQLGYGLLAGACVALIFILRKKWK